MRDSEGLLGFPIRLGLPALCICFLTLIQADSRLRMTTSNKFELLIFNDKVYYNQWECDNKPMSYYKYCLCLPNEFSGYSAGEFA